jgi:uncharacterized ion transporter superfamily protein YfcC
MYSKKCEEKMDFEHEIKKINKRNNRVEIEKSWEVSKTRRIAILVITYVFMLLIMYVLKLSDPFINAIIPTCGFFLSGLSIGVLKNIWMRFIYKK